MRTDKPMNQSTGSFFLIDHRFLGERCSVSPVEAHLRVWTHIFITFCMIHLWSPYSYPSEFSTVFAYEMRQNPRRRLSRIVFLVCCSSKPIVRNVYYFRYRSVYNIFVKIISNVLRFFHNFYQRFYWSEFSFYLTKDNSEMFFFSYLTVS